MSLAHCKLVQILSLVEKQEWASLHEFILGHTSLEADVFEIFLFFKSHKDRLTDLPDTDSVINAHFPHLSPKVFQNYLSVLFGWTESWMAHQEMLHKKYELELLTLEAYNRRGAYKLADQTYKLLEKKLNAVNCLDIDVAQTQYRAIHSQYFSNNPIKYEVGGSLLETYVISWLTATKEHAAILLTEMHNFGTIMDYDYEQLINTMRSLLPLLPQSELALNLELLVKLYAENDISAFESLVTSVKNKQYPDGSFTHTLISLYLIVKGNTLHSMGKLHNVASIAELYNIAMESGILMDKGRISMVRFTNMISALSAIESYDWVEKFITRWIGNVSTTDLQGSTHLAHALNCFYHEQYVDVIQFTAQTSYGSQDQKLRAFALHVIALYVLRFDDYETFKTQLKNFSLSLHRQKKSLNKKQYFSYFNLVDFLKKMDLSDRKAVNIDLSIYNYLVYRTWCEKMLQKKRGH